MSATEGDIESKLGKLDHWPDRVEAVEGEWRDYYTGEQTWKSVKIRINNFLACKKNTHTKIIKTP